MKADILQGNFPTNPSEKWVKFKERHWDQVPHAAGVSNDQGMWTGQMANSVKVNWNEKEHGTDVKIFAEPEVHWRMYYRGHGDYGEKQINKLPQKQQTDDILAEIDKTFSYHGLMKAFGADLSAKGYNAWGAAQGDDGFDNDKVAPLIKLYEDRFKSMGASSWVIRIFQDIFPPWVEETRSLIKSVL